MKKIYFFIFPLIMGLFSGWFIECFLCVLSIIMSPFSTYEESKFLIFCGINSLVSALLFIVITIADVLSFKKLKDKKKMRFALILQACATIFAFLSSWYYAEQVIDVLYGIF